MTADSILGLIAVNLVVPASLQLAAEQLIEPGIGLAGTIDKTVTRSIRALNVIVDPFLDAYSAVEFYLTCAFSQIDTAEVGFLKGQTAPTLMEFETADFLSLTFRANMAWNAKCIDYRSVYKSSGA